MRIHILISITITAYKSPEILGLHKKMQFIVCLAVLAGTAQSLGIFCARTVHTLLLPLNISVCLPYILIESPDLILKQCNKRFLVLYLRLHYTEITQLGIHILFGRKKDFLFLLNLATECSSLVAHVLYSSRLRLHLPDTEDACQQENIYYPYDVFFHSKRFSRIKLIILHSRQPNPATPQDSPFHKQRKLFLERI